MSCDQGGRPQRQDSLMAQLVDVAAEAERIGCRDAADWIRRQVKLKALITPAARANAVELMKEYRD